MYFHYFFITEIQKKNRNQVLSNQRKAVRNYYHEQFEIRGQNTKSGWTLIHFLAGLGNKNASKNMNAFLINGKLIADNIVLADSFNEYFVNIEKGIFQKITSTVDPLSYSIYIKIIPILQKIRSILLVYRTQRSIM